VIVLDDIHLADGSSWEALNYLTRNLVGCRILLLLAARPAELPEARIANDVLLGLEQEGLLRRLTVAALPADDSRDLAESVIGGPVPDAPVTRLMDRARGSPLFVLLRALVDESADLEHPAVRAMPEDLAERVEGRVAQLDPAVKPYRPSSDLLDAKDTVLGPTVVAEDGRTSSSSAASTASSTTSSSSLPLIGPPKTITPRSTSPSANLACSAHARWSRMPRPLSQSGPLAVVTAYRHDASTSTLAHCGESKKRSRTSLLAERRKASPYLRQPIEGRSSRRRPFRCRAVKRVERGGL
jgi:hypothetical protein